VRFNLCVLIYDHWSSRRGQKMACARLTSGFNFTMTRH